MILFEVDIGAIAFVAPIFAKSYDKNAFFDELN
jgi:hypothetical protein